MIRCLHEAEILYQYDAFSKMRDIAEKVDNAETRGNVVELAINMRTCMEEICALALACYNLDLSSTSEEKLSYIESLGMLDENELN